MKTVLLFSGQGAQYPGMMRDVVDAYPAARELFSLAKSELARDVYEDVCSMSQGQLNETRNTQVCMLTCELAGLRILRELRVPYDAVAGFSLGEWGAVVGSGVVSEQDALRFIVYRANAMQRAVPAGEGAMAYMLGKDDDFVLRFCEEVGNVVPANYNIRGNVSVAGTAEGIERFLERGEQDGLLVGRIPVSIPSHCWLMQPAADELSSMIRTMKMKPPEKRLYMNVTGEPAAEVDQIRKGLTLQLTHPVMFRKTVDALLADGFDTFIEVGPGSTLVKMVKKAAKQQGCSVRVMQTGSVEAIRKIEQAME